MVQRVTLGDAARGAADDDRKLGFPIELLRHLRIVADRVVPRDDGGRRLREDHRLLRQFFRRVETACRFSDMLGIVETDSEDILAGAREDRKSVVEGTSVSGRVERGGRRILKKKKKQI